MHRDSAWVDQWQEESELWNFMVWREPTDHVTDCYFCAVDVTGINRKNRGSLKYSDLQSARRPVTHCDEIPVPIFGELPDISDEDASSVEGHDYEEEVVLENNAPHPFFPKGVEWASSWPQLVNGLCRTVDIQIEGKKPPLLKCSHQLLPQQASRVPPFFLYIEVLGVLCRYCAASAQAWSHSTNPKIGDCSLTAASDHWNVFCSIMATSLPLYPSLSRQHWRRSMKRCSIRWS